MIALEQISAGTPPGSFLVGAAYALILGLQGYQLKATSNLKDEVLKFRVLLTGIDGGNGMNQTVKEHTEKLGGLRELTDNLEFRVADLEKGPTIIPSPTPPAPTTVVLTERRKRARRRKDRA